MRNMPAPQRSQTTASVAVCGREADAVRGREAGAVAGRLSAGVACGADAGCAPVARGGSVVGWDIRAIIPGLE
jgi:hypothetical protein